MGMDKLKPCPFCGSDAIYRVRNNGYLDDTAAVFCNSCKSIMFTEENDQEGVNDKTEKIAADAWNKRCDSTPCWIPCSERLPEKDGLYIVSVINDHNRRYSKTCWYHGHEKWFARQDVIAWMPLPEPYREDGDNDAY